jgi:hypothetical protein
MSTILNPYGMRPAYSPQGMAAARGYPNGIASGYGTGILKYQPVALNSSGDIVAATSGADFLGVLCGVKWIDASGVPHVSDQWIAGTTYNNASGSISNGYGIEVQVWDDPNMVFVIQADGSLAQSIGGQVNFTAANIANGSTTTGLSTCTAQAASLSTNAQKQLRIVELADSPSITGSTTNAWGDAYTEIRVMNAQHQYIANKVAV